MTSATASAQARRGRPTRHLGTVAPVLLPAVALFALAYDNGGYSLASRSSWGILVWWVLVLGAVVGWWRRGLSRPATLVAGGLAGLALVTLASGLWGPSWEAALVEFNRVTLYLGIFVLATLAARETRVGRLLDGLALGIAAILTVALLSRFIPGLFSDRGAAETLPSAVARLSFPVGYWNGLAILGALGVPLLLRRAAADTRALARALAVGAIPAVAAVAYLASSRGGFAVALIAALAFLALSGRRWWTVAAIGIGGAASAATVWVLSEQTSFVNDPTSSAAAAERLPAFLALVGGCASAALAFAFVVVALRGRRSPSHAIAASTVTAAALVTLAAGLAVDPAERVRDFTRPPVEEQVASEDFARSHLLSASGSGRWQFWEAAVDAFQERPLAGHGAGTYEAWWAERGTLSRFTRDAHSLYLETAAELGLVGLLLLLAVLAGAVMAARTVRTAPLVDRAAASSGLAVFLGFAAGAAIDWMWELPAVGAAGFAALGFAAAAAPPARARGPEARYGLVALLALGSWFVLCAHALPYLTELRIRASQEAAARGDHLRAAEAARGATAIQPWAASPWLQLGLVREEQGELRQAREALERALRRNPRDWRLWLAAARVQARLGAVAEARRSLRTARELNPRSPLFARLDE